MCDPSKTNIDEVKRKYQEQLERCKRLVSDTANVESQAQRQLDRISRLITQAESTPSCLPCPFSPTRSCPQQLGQGPPLASAPGDLMAFEGQGPAPMRSPHESWPQRPLGPVVPHLPQGPRSDWIPPEKRAYVQKISRQPGPPPPGFEPTWTEEGTPCGEVSEPNIRWPKDYPGVSGPLPAPWAQEEAVQEYDPYYRDPSARSIPSSPQGAGRPCMPCSPSRGQVPSGRSPSPRSATRMPQESRSPTRHGERPRTPSPPPAGQSRSPTRQERPRTPSPPPPTPCPVSGPSAPTPAFQQLEYMRALFGVQESPPCPPQARSAPSSPVSPRAGSPPAPRPPPPPRSPPRSPPPPARSPPPPASPPGPPAMTGESAQEYFQKIRQFYGVGEECPGTPNRDVGPQSPQSPPPNLSEWRDDTNPAHQYLYEPYMVQPPSNLLSPVEEAHPVDELGSGMDDYTARAGLERVRRPFECPFDEPMRDHTFWGDKGHTPLRPQDYFQPELCEVEEDDMLEYLKADEADEFKYRQERAKQQQQQQHQSPCPGSSPRSRSPSPRAEMTSPQSPPRRAPGRALPDPAAQAQVSADALEIIRQARARLDCAFRNTYGEGLDEYFSK